MLRARYAAAALLLPALHAQYAPPPDAYSLTGVNSMMGAPVSIKVFRDGNRAVMDSAAPGVHTYTVYDLAAHSSVTWMPENPAAPCNKASFSGDWGDPFALSAELHKQAAAQHARDAGSEDVNGMAAKVLEASSANGSSAKAWVEPKYGLVLKLAMGAKGVAPQTIVEVKSFTPGKPDAAVFAIPAACGKAAAPPAAPPVSADFADAIMPPASAKSCTALLRVVRAGAMTPITGFKIAVDGQDRTAQMQNGVLRIADMPAHFNVDVSFGDAGSSSALIYRQCFHPETVLMLMVKNPAKLSDGADWRWKK